jgi:hypothetical protein
MKEFEKELVVILNDWYDNLEPVDESDYVKFTFAKNKFKNMYFQKVGEFLKITQRIETLYFNKIAQGLSLNYNFTEELLDEYLEWCFKNYDYFVHKYKSFNLRTISHLAKEWNKDLFKFDEEEKITLKDLKDITVSDNVFDAFELYGIPLSTTKLNREIRIPKDNLEDVIIKKLRTITNSENDLIRLKNMLRVTVENSPYSSEVIFKNYKSSLNEFFQYFSGEPWAK